MTLPRVLVVHRDRLARRFLSRALSDSSDVSTAVDGREALALLATTRFDVVLSDDVAATIASTSPGTEVVEFVDVGGGAPVGGLGGRGVIERVTDPFDPDSVTAAVQRAVERRALRAEIERLRGELENARDRRSP